MKIHARWLIPLLGVASLSSILLFAAAGPAGVEPLTLKGTIVDLPWHLAPDSANAGHDGARCVAEGATVGFVEKGILGETVYVVLEDPLIEDDEIEFADYVDREVTVECRELKAGGLHGLKISKVQEVEKAPTSLTPQEEQSKH